ncbi:MAG: hypothetical protein IT456_25540 [Planctomycetes bacterium]|nr:hypothetical protein [Planctomycetota bacterium]
MSAITDRSARREAYLRFLRSTGFDCQRSDTRRFSRRRWSCVFPTSFRQYPGDPCVWLVVAYTQRGVMRKASRRRIKDLRILDRINHHGLARHEMRAGR